MLLGATLYALEISETPSPTMHTAAKTVSQSHTAVLIKVFCLPPPPAPYPVPYLLLSLLDPPAVPPLPVPKIIFIVLILSRV